MKCSVVCSKVSTREFYEKVLVIEYGSMCLDPVSGKYRAGLILVDPTPTNYD